DKSNKRRAGRGTLTEVRKQKSLDFPALHRLPYSQRVAVTPASTTTWFQTALGVRLAQPTPTAMKRLLRLFPLGLTLAAVVLSATGSSAQTTGGRDSQSRVTPRLDAQLSTLAGTTVEPQRVIVRVRPGARAALRQSLSSHNDLILAEHDSLDAITAVVHAEDLALLAARSDVLSISADAVVRPHDLIGGLVGLVGGGFNTL